MKTDLPRVIIVGLASDFGCQLQITNAEPHLMEILSQFELGYWQLASSGPMPETYDIAVIEGAVATEEHERLVREIRQKATSVIVIGACACTAGIPGLSLGSDDSASIVYREFPSGLQTVIPVRPVEAVIDVDYRVPGCPIETLEFVSVLQHALMNLSKPQLTGDTMCGSCKEAENTCFYSLGRMCLGLVTTSGCGARCVCEGRPCNGCRGLSSAANIEQARAIVERYGADLAAFDAALELFNAASEQESAGKERTTARSTSTGKGL